MVGVKTLRSNTHSVKSLRLRPALMALLRCRACHSRLCHYFAALLQTVFLEWDHQGAHGPEDKTADTHAGRCHSSFAAFDMYHPSFL